MDAIILKEGILYVLQLRYSKVRAGLIQLFGILVKM